MEILKAALLIIGAVLFTAVFFALIVLRIIRKKYHHPAPALLGYLLDSRWRRFWQPPSVVLGRSGVRPGTTVVDLGCGSGAFTTFAARAVGQQGKVYAVDMQPAMLRQLERKLARPENRDLTNVELRQASAYELPFADDSIDLVYMVTVLMEIPDPGRGLREIKRVLKPGGILAVTEWLPDPDYPFSSTVIKLGRREGFILEQKQGNLWTYTVRFRKPGSASA